MRAKSMVLLVVALGCGMIAAVGVSQAMMQQDTGEKKEPLVEIFVAVKDLDHAEQITAEKIRLDKWPKSRVPEGALTKLEQVEGMFTKLNIFADEPILEKKIAASRDSFSTGVPPGYRIFDIVGTASYIKPGDRVDILGTFKVGGRNAVPESHTVMRNIKVHGINGVTTRNSDEDGKTSKTGRGGTKFQLLVKESQLEALTLAKAMAGGELQLHLRPLGEDNEITDNGEGFKTWLKANQEPEEVAEEEPQAGLLTTLQIPDPEPETKKNRMVVIGSNGIKTYEWTDDDELPTEVLPETESPQSNNLFGNPNGNGNGNVYSGYGGYTPTYPNGTVAPPPAQAGGVPPEDAIPEAQYN